MAGERLGLVALKEHVFDNEIPIPPKKPTLFDLIEHTDDGVKEYPLLSVGGVMGVTGKTGTAKSTILSLLHTAFFTESKEYLNIKCNVKKGSLLWVDTEMAESSDFMYFQKNLHDRLGTKQNIPYYRGINLKYCFSNLQRYETILDILENVNNKREGDYFESLRVIILDGFADILNDTNNESEAREKLNRITSLADEKGIGIVTVLHTDKRGHFARGFAGSMLENESQTMLKTGRYSPNDPFKISCDKIRGAAPFHPFYIEFHDNGVDMVLQDDSDNIIFEFTMVSTNVSGSSINTSNDKKYKFV